MLYRDCLLHLERKGDELFNADLGLDRMQAVVGQLGECHVAVPTVLVAGTNGKGSAARCLAAIGRHAGLKTGLFTSPHLVRIRERIAIAGRAVDRHSFARHFTRAVKGAERAGVELSFFETLTATAFSLFADRGVDLAVLEVGLGGRLDATNVAEPELSILTSISFDHQNLLGSDLSTIALEKLGIVRANRPVVSVPQVCEVEETVRAWCRKLEAPLCFVNTLPASDGRESGGRFPFRRAGLEFEPAMRGRSQVENLSAAVEAALLLRSRFPQLDHESLRSGVASAFSLGVLHSIGSEPPVLLDGGHNPAAAARLAEYLEEFTEPPRQMLFGLMQDKDAEGVLKPLSPLFEEILLTAVASPRAADPGRLQQLCPSAGLAADPAEAYLDLKRKPGLLVVAGSFYLAGLVAKLEGL